MDDLGALVDVPSVSTCTTLRSEVTEILEFIKLYTGTSPTLSLEQAAFMLMDLGTAGGALFDDLCAIARQPPREVVLWFWRRCATFSFSPVQHIEHTSLEQLTAELDRVLPPHDTITHSASSPTAEVHSPNNTHRVLSHMDFLLVQRTGRFDLSQLSGGCESHLLGLEPFSPGPGVVGIDGRRFAREEARESAKNDKDGSHFYNDLVREKKAIVGGLERKGDASGKAAADTLLKTDDRLRLEPPEAGEEKDAAEERKSPDAAAPAPRVDGELDGHHEDLDYSMIINSVSHVATRGALLDALSPASAASTPLKITLATVLSGATFYGDTWLRQSVFNLSCVCDPSNPFAQKFVAILLAPEQLIQLLADRSVKLQNKTLVSSCCYTHLSPYVSHLSYSYARSSTS